MENQQKVTENYLYHTVSIDGRSHGDMLLVAIGSGATLAVIILIILISLIKHKKKFSDDDKKIIESASGDIIFTTSASNLHSPALQKSNLMFKYFGRSLSSFDVDKSYTKSDSVAINIELDHDKLQIYRKHVLTPSDVFDADSLKNKYIQTIAV
ncbi:uncharacterized protein [Chironomus tepperi]|uniref:uncharacterized protein n=1 Tax=Chironomus tepperi TaxID=113505 RepID=UPI00391F97B6